MGQGLFSRPHGIRVDPDGNVWTVDASSSKVLEFTPAGDLLMQVQLDRPEREDRFCGATDLAFEPDGHVFVADGYCNSRIVEINGGGDIVREWGAPGAGPGEFDIPHAIVYGPDGLLYVADRENRRVLRFTATGEFVDSWEYAGQLLGIAFAPSGRLFLSLSLGGGPVDAHVVEVNPGTGEMLARAEVVAHELSVAHDGTVLPAAYDQQVLLLRLAND